MPTLQLVIGAAIAAAILALAYVIRGLAKEMRRLSDATSQPFVVATIEPDPWSMLHIDLRLENSGNAPAFDVQASIIPRAGQSGSASTQGPGTDAIDVLRPGQRVSSFLAEGEDVLDAVYQVEVSWRRLPDSLTREGIAYDVDMRKWEKMSRPDALSPLHEVAAELKRLRRDWRSIARGQRPLEVSLQTDAVATPPPAEVEAAPEEPAPRPRRNRSQDLPAGEGREARTRGR